MDCLGKQPPFQDNRLHSWSKISHETSEEGLPQDCCILCLPILNSSIIRFSQSQSYTYIERFSLNYLIPDIKSQGQPLLPSPFRNFKLSKQCSPLLLKFSKLGFT